MMGVTSPLQAQTEPDEPLSLTWNAPPICPSEDDVRSDVLRLVGELPATQSTLKATATVGLGGGGWQLLLETEWEGRLGQRSLQAPTCKTVANAAALTLALMLNPNSSAALQGPSPEPAPPEPEPAPPEPPEPEPTPPEPENASRRNGPLETSLAVGASFGAGLGRLPAVDAEVAIGGISQLGRWSFALSAIYGLPQSREVVEHPTARGRLTFGSLRMDGCWALIDSGWRLSPCLTAALGGVFGTGEGIESAQSGAIFWTELGALARLDLPVSDRVRLHALLGASGPMKRPSVIIEDVGDGAAELLKAAPLAATAQLGVTIRVW